MTTIQRIDQNAIKTPNDRENTQEFLHCLEETIQMVFSSTQDLFFPPGSPNPKKFLSYKTIEKWDHETETFIQKIQGLLQQKWEFFKMGKYGEQLLENGRTTIPKELKEELLSRKETLQNLSPEQWNTIILDQKEALERNAEQILSTYPSAETFVLNFNQKKGLRKEYKKKALAILNSLKQIAWEQNTICRVPNTERICYIRKYLYWMYKCDDKEIRSLAITELTDLLDSDPINPETDADLLWLHKKLLYEIQANTIADVKEQRELAKACRSTLLCILFQISNGNFNAFADSLKQDSLKYIKNFNDFNISSDLEIEAWINDILQTLARIKTEMPEWKQWIPRILAFGHTIVRIKSVIDSPEEIINAIEESVIEFTEAFDNLEFKEAEFEISILLIKITKLALYEENSFKELSGIYQKTILSTNNDNVLFTAVSTLEHAILHSPSEAIQEEVFRILIQHMTTGKPSPMILSRIIEAFTRVLDQKPALRNTAFIILQLLEQIPQFKEQEIWEKLQTSSPYIELLDKSCEKIYNSTETALYKNVIRYFLSRIDDIKISGSESIGGILARFRNPALAIPMLNTLNQLVPHLLDPDPSTTHTLYHIGTKESNTYIIEYAHQMPAQDINAQERKFGNTALHIAIENNDLQTVLLLIELGADPNIRNHNGDTPLHLAARNPSRDDSITQFLLQQDDININTHNDQIETPLNIAIKNNAIPIMASLIRHGGVIAEEINQISPLFYAADQYAEEAVIYLNETRVVPLTLFEMYKILRMISNDGINVSASTFFCDYHISKLKNDEEYRQKSELFQSFPTLKMGGKLKRKFTLSEKRTYSIGTSTIKHQHQDDFGNTKLILHASKEKKIEGFKTLVDKTRSINRQNYFGVTALHTAVFYQNTKAIKRLIENEARTDITDIQGFTPMHFAALSGNLKILCYLIKHCTSLDWDTPNHYGDTPLLILCGHNPTHYPESLCSITEKDFFPPKPLEDFSILETLIDQGGDIRVQDAAGNNALHHAIDYGSTNIIHELYLHYPELTWQRNHNHELPIERVVKMQRQINLDRLVEKDALLELHEKFLEETEGYPLANVLAIGNFSKKMSELFELNPDLADFRDSTPHQNTPIDIAAKYGSIDIIDVYQEFNKSLDNENLLGDTPAHIATTFDQVEFLKKLAKNQVNLSKTNHLGETLLHIAVGRRSKACVNYLSQHEKLIKKKDAHGDLPLHLACKEGSLLMTKKIHEAYPSALTKEGAELNTPLHYACENGYLPVVKYLVDSGAKVDAKNRLGATPLMNAAFHGHANVVEYLLSLKEENADITIQDFSLETALHKATSMLHLEVVKILLNAKRNQQNIVTIKDIDGETSLHELFKIKMRPGFKVKNQMEIFRLHLEHNADLFEKKDTGENVFHLMCLYGSVNGLNTAIRHLRKKRKLTRFKIDSKDKQGNTLFHKAVMGSHLDVVYRLLELGANINCKNDKGETPFLLAVKLGFYDLAHLLRIEKAHAKIPDKDEQNIVHVILEKDFLNEKDLCFLCAMLKEKPELIFSKNKQKQTPLHVLAKNGHTDALRLLLAFIPSKKVEKYLNKKAGDQRAIDLAKNNKLHARLAIYVPEHSPLIDAIENGYFFLADTLISENFNLWATNGDGESLLHLLSQHPYSEDLYKFAKRLIKKTPHLLLHKDHNKNTPFHVVAQYGQYRLLKKMLQKFPLEDDDLKDLLLQKNGNKESVLDLANKHQNKNMYHRLRDLIE